MKTRFSPSPTGLFHIGSLRTALLNYLMARSNNGTFILRIDDTDLERNKPENVDYIYDTMKSFKLDYDLTFSQSSRLDRYLEVAKKIGIKTENGYEIDMGGYKMVILRNNGYPTYNFCSILDDYDYDITDIIRGVDHINNLEKQVKIWNMISSVEGEKTFPNVHHAGLLFQSGRKISKRDGTSSMEFYKDFNKEAVLNWIFKLGWAHPDANFDKKYPILSIHDMIKIFNEGHITKKNCGIDLNKLNFLNKKWTSRKNMYEPVPPHIQKMMDNLDNLKYPRI